MICILQSKMLQAEPGEPVARLTPLGWTCAGPINCQRGGDLQNNFAFTYFVKDQREVSDEISNLLRGFWEIESYGTSTVAHVMTADERTALRKLEKSIKYVEGRYQVAIPWKDVEPELPDNYKMALRRLSTLKNSY